MEYNSKINNKLFKIIFIIILIYILKSEYKISVPFKYPSLIIDDYKHIFELLITKKYSFLFKNKTKLECIFILIIIFPFLDNEILITKENPIFDVYNQIYNYNNNIITINKNSIKLFAQMINNFLYYKWEFLPAKNITNYIRHILFHYYPETCINIFDNSLNFNIKNYINSKRKTLSIHLIFDLMSKI